MVRIGLVGCGTIGSQLARAIERKYHRSARLVALHDQDPVTARRLQRHLSGTPPLCSLPALIQRSHLVIEAASGAAAARVTRLALRAKRDVFVMSVGGLLHDRSWQQLARRNGRRVYIPSGALAGLDGVKALAVGTVRSVSLTTRKPSRALAGAPYVKARKLNLSARRRPVIVFEGSARMAVKAFPQNTNVAATLTLASGVSDRKTRVRVIADPASRVNVHEVEVRGDCGRIRCRVESRPSRLNPKTSELAIRSAIATLDQALNPIRIGT